LSNQEFIAAGSLKQDEKILNGKDGRTYKSRQDTIQVDKELTEAMHITRDPIMPLVDALKQSAGNTSNNILKSCKSNNFRRKTSYCTKSRVKNQEP